MQRLEPEEIESQTFPLVRRGYDAEKVDAFLRVVAAYYREAIRQSEAQEELRSAPSRPFDDLGDQVASILGTAARAAEDLKLNADREIQQMRRIAAQEAAETTQAATNQLALARQVKANAQQEAESMLAEAREQATKLKEQAAEEAERRKHDANALATRVEKTARDRAGKLEEAGNAKVASILAEARRRYDQLQNASQQSASHLRSVESLLRKVREELTGERPLATAEDFSVDDLKPEGHDGQIAPPPTGDEGSFPPPDAHTDELIADVLEKKPPRPDRRKKASASKARASSNGPAPATATGEAPGQPPPE